MDPRCVTRKTIFSSASRPFGYLTAPSRHIGQRRKSNTEELQNKEIRFLWQSFFFFTSLCQYTMASAPENRRNKRRKRLGTTDEQDQETSPGSAPYFLREKVRKVEIFFIRNANLIINRMVELSSGIRSCLVDEVLHSIFFLGGLCSPPFSPEEILTERKMLNKLKSSYPQAFKYFKSKLPRRSPLSCVMDMIVNKTGQQKENEILSSLNALILKLKEGNATELISSTACVSQPNNKDQKSTRYYGLSMSTSECLPGRIVVAAACLSNWDEYVAGAVMTFYPAMEKKTYFDGTIRLPGQVRCQAFNLSQLQEMPPCKSCANLFGLTGDDKKSWPYGNCAENESVSNLLKKEQKVKEKSQPLAPSCTEENRKKAKESMEKELKDYLKMKNFSWDETFYTPS